MPLSCASCTKTRRWWRGEEDARCPGISSCILSGVIDVQNCRRFIPRASRHRWHPRHHRCPHPNHVSTVLTILGTVVTAPSTPRASASAPLSRRVPQPPFTACSHLGSVTTAVRMSCLCSHREYTTQRFTFGPHGTETQIKTLIQQRRTLRAAAWSTSTAAATTTRLPASARPASSTATSNPATFSSRITPRPNNGLWDLTREEES